MDTTETEPQPFGERLLGAACTLNAPELRARMGAWRGLRERARVVESVPGGVRLTLAADEQMADVVDLVLSESECCPFYTFAVVVEGPDRRLEISAGPAGALAVDALLGREA